MAFFYSHKTVTSMRFPRTYFLEGVGGIRTIFTTPSMLPSSLKVVDCEELTWMEWGNQNLRTC